VHKTPGGKILPGVNPRMNESKQPLVFDHQEAAFRKLCLLTETCSTLDRGYLPLKPRTNTLLVGPSGSGKTHLVSAVAKVTGAQFLSLSISEWVLLGCSTRGAVPTWPAIVDFLYKNEQSKGVLIFLDELDKISGKSTWEAYQRTEIFKLLDLDIPTGMCDRNEEKISNYEYEKAQKVLTTKTMIVGAGAFQNLWDHPVKSCGGFGAHEIGEVSLSPSKLTETIPRELVNRFRSEILILPEMKQSDYEEILLKSAESMPEYLQRTYMELGLERIQRACEAKQGCRFVEELLLDSLIAEKEAMREMIKKINLKLSLKTSGEEF